MLFDPPIQYLLWFNVLIFLLLSLLHLYWSASGNWAFDAVLPRDEGGRRLLNPRRIDSFIVGTALLSMGAYLSVWGANVSIDLGPALAWFWDNAVWGMVVVFLLRAVGEFRYLGFFKRFRESRFAWWDSCLYSPLCLWLGGSILGLIYLR